MSLALPPRARSLFVCGKPCFPEKPAGYLFFFTAGLDPLFPLTFPRCPLGVFLQFCAQFPFWQLLLCDFVLLPGNSLPLVSFFFVLFLLRCAGRQGKGPRTRCPSILKSPLAVVGAWGCDAGALSNFFFSGELGLRFYNASQGPSVLFSFFRCIGL